MSISCKHYIILNKDLNQPWILSTGSPEINPSEMLREGTHVHCPQYTCQRPSMKPELYFLYHNFEVSMEDQARAWGLIRAVTSAKVSTKVIRNWIWNSTSSSPCWVMAFLKTVQGSSVVPILSSQTMALKPGPHGNIQVFCLLKSYNHERQAHWLLS